MSTITQAGERLHRLTFSDCQAVDFLKTFFPEADVEFDFSNPNPHVEWSVKMKFRTKFDQGQVLARGFNAHVEFDPYHERPFRVYLTASANYDLNASFFTFAEIALWLKDDEYYRFYRNPETVKNAA